MALEGQLSDFNLAEILQLIASQQKSGFLILEGRREMVFVFDKGQLISTRDRRSRATDPLETFLRAYGFLTEAQWKHVEFIRSNSSLDLTEVLVSEELFDDEQLMTILKSLAQEMTHKGMKMRRGRYHFTATKDTPPGVRYRYQIDVQSLLMEAARRLDEEQLLNEMFSSQAITFKQGAKVPGSDQLSPAGKRIIQLALAGESLGRIIRTGNADSFTVRDLLKNFCEEEFLVLVKPSQKDSSGGGTQESNKKSRLQTPLKSLTLSVLVMVVLLAAGYYRWTPLFSGEIAVIGLGEMVYESFDTGPGDTQSVRRVSTLTGIQQSNRQLRLRQVQDEIVRALDLYHYEHGEYPQQLMILVNQGMLTSAVYQTATNLGWTYDLIEKGRGFSLAA